MKTENKPTITLTADQKKAFESVKMFMNSYERVFILKGYAGTGKTTLIKEVLSHFDEHETRYRLLASTGRAAKILSDITGCVASTIHSMIYKFDDFNQDLDQIVKEREKHGVDKSGQLFLQFNLVGRDNIEDDETCYYIVDESSMIADTEDKSIKQASFGSGRLLTDLLSYDPQGKFIFVGDDYQLPPVKLTFSPALSFDYFKDEHKIQPYGATLSKIMRQCDNNDIIQASFNIRKKAQKFVRMKWGKLPLRGYKHIKLYSSSYALMNAYVDYIRKDGLSDVTMLCSSNKTCGEIADLIRPFLGRKGEVQVGDLLLVTQNNVSGLMNGDLVVVTQKTASVEHRANLTFRKVEVKELGSGDCYSRFIIEDIIYDNSLNLSTAAQKELFIDFHIRMKKAGFKQNSEVYQNAMRDDPYLNAIRAVYGYGLTCHKAQGGEWNNVFIHLKRNFTLEATPATYQWLYTAITRAKVQLHITNDFYIE